MIFATPALLWALPLVAVPIVIHLLQRRRYRRLEFSAMDFLERALRRTRKRVLLEDLLLLVLRTAALLALILALAGPTAEDLPVAMGREARAEILILDASMSMSQEEDGLSAFQVALEFARERLQPLDRGFEDQAALFRAGLRAERLSAGDPAEVRSSLQELEAPDASVDTLTEAVHAARASLAELSVDPTQLRVSLLTDLQANRWHREAPLLSALEALVSSGCAVEVVDCGYPQRENVAVVGLELASPRMVAGDSSDALVSVRNFGHLPQEVEVSLRLDDATVASKRFALAAQEQRDWNVALSPLQAGARAVEARVEHDGLVLDDRRAAILTVDDGLRVLLVGEEATRTESPGVFEAIHRYLALGERAPLRPLTMPPGDLDEDALAEADLLVLADPGNLLPRACRAVESFLRQGGGVLLAVGPATGMEELQGLRSVLHPVGLTIYPVVTRDDAPARLEILDPDDPALRFFTDPRWQPLLTEVPFHGYRPLQLDPAAAMPAAASLAFLDPQTHSSAAALVQWTQGVARLAVLSAAPHARWNRMEEVPGGTLPLLYDLLFSLAPDPGYPVSVAVGEALRVHLPHPPTKLELMNPDGLRRSGDLESEVLVDGRHRVELLPSAHAPGVWNLQYHLLMPDGEEVPSALRLAVVPPSEESDLRPATLATLQHALPQGVVLATPQERAQELPEQSQARQDFTRLLFLLTLIALIAESLLATHLDRRRSL